MTKRIYIAGKISGLDPHITFDRFSKYAEYVKEMGHEPVNPWTINNIEKEDIGTTEFLARDWSSCLKNDIKQLVDCDEIHLLPGWSTSKGAELERDIAMRLGINVVYV